MADNPIGGPYTPTQPTPPFPPSNDTGVGIASNQNTQNTQGTTQSPFENYLNQQPIMYEGQQPPNGPYYDPANDISNNSVYLKPGENTPT